MYKYVTSRQDKKIISLHDKRSCFITSYVYSGACGIAPWYHARAHVCDLVLETTKAGPGI